MARAPSGPGALISKDTPPKPGLHNHQPAAHLGWLYNNFLKTITSIGEDVEKRELLCIAGGNVKWHSQFGKVCQFLKKSSTELPQYSAAPPRRLPKRNRRLCVRTKLCTNVHSSLFTTAIGKQPKRCRLRSGGGKRLLGTEEGHSAVEREEVLTRVTTWMNPEDNTTVKEARHKRLLLCDSFIRIVQKKFKERK